MFLAKLEGLSSFGNRCVSADPDALLAAQAAAAGDFPSGVWAAEVFA